MIRRKTKLNPTDHDLISKLEVKKAFPPYGVKYEVYLGKRRIAFADIDHGSTEISFVQVNEGYKLRGVATFLYDYIEKDLGRKLKPSEALIEDGEAFWKARNKRSNPRDDELLKHTYITKSEFDPKKIVYSIRLYNYDYSLGFATYDVTKKIISDVRILDRKFRNKGLATYLYNYIENDQNIILKPSNTLSEDGKAFWQNRLKKNPKPQSRR